MRNDPQKYRVTLFSKVGSGSYGYGPTVKEARTAALRFFRGSHGSEKPKSEALDVLSDDGARYVHLAHVDCAEEDSKR